MSYQGSWKIDDYLTFVANTHDPDTGVATDADSVPTYRVYEDETGTPILTGSMALLDSANTAGFYSERIQLTAANGFEKGKSYNIYIVATVDGDTGTMHHSLQIEAEVDANTVSATADVNVTQISGDSTAADNLELDYDGTGYNKSASEIATVAALTGHTAQTGDSYGRLGAPAGASIAADLVAIDNFVDDLETRLTAARAGYLDELAAANLPADVDTLLSRITAAVALASVCTEARLAELDAANVPADVDTLLSRLTAARAGYLDELGAANVPADVDTLLTRITAAVALASVCTEARLAELDAANVPADVDTLLTRITAAVALASVCTEARLAELDAANLPADIDALPTTAEVNAEVDTALADIDLDHLIQVTAGAEEPTDGSYLDQIMHKDVSQTFDATTDSLEAIRDRGDAAWTTGGGGSISDILNVHPLIPENIDLANTAAWRLGLMLINSLDDLPTTAEIDPGTISIDRKAIGATSWSSIVSDAACSELAGLIYYDEVFDTATGYVEGDSIRVTLKGQKITVAANDYEISDANGRVFYTEIRQTVRGTDNAALASVCTEARLAELAAANVPADVDTLLTRITAAVALASVCTEARLAELDGANVPADVDTLLSRLTAARAGYLDELGAANVPADVDTLLTRITAAVALASVCTEARLAELDAANVPADVDTLLTRITAAVALASVCTEARLAELDAANMPADIDALPTTAEVNAEVDTALSDIHLDHLLAADYNPASKPGVGTALLNEMVEDDGGVSRYTQNALEQAPSGTGGDATAANQNTIITHLTDVKGGTFAGAMDSLEAIRDRGDAAWTTGSGGTAGSGAITFTYTLTSSVDGAPIAQADVWVTTDQAGTNVIASGTTSDTGTVTFYLDAGTYYVWRAKSGWNFANPDTEVVA